MKMKKEYDDLLCKKFPRLFADRYKDPSTTCMYWGFDCNDGWFQIIHDAAEELELEIEKYVKKYGEEQASELKASQVKEKFGTLNFYLRSGTEQMYWIIGIASRRSTYTCEDCGSEDAKIRPLGWIRTLCYDCYIEVISNRLVKKDKEDISRSLRTYFPMKPLPKYKRDIWYKLGYLRYGWWWKSLPRDTLYKLHKRLWFVKRRLSGKRCG